ncbi:MAG: NfeD family protein [Sporomusaceae bacterium]|nr:NfeD family protein [Sporomusaceae bacterium]
MFFARKAWYRSFFTVFVIFGVAGTKCLAASTGTDMLLSPWEQAAGLLEIPLIKGFLVTLIFTALLTEIKTVGSGVGILTALIAASLLLGGQWLLRGGWMPALLSFSGIFLLVAELFFPGTAIFALSGLVLLLGGLFLALGGDGPALQFLAASLITAVVIFSLMARFLPQSAFVARFILKDREAREKGFHSVDDHAVLVGLEGVAVTTLRPAGTALIAGKKIDVVTEGDYIASGEKIVVLAVSGRRVIVRTLRIDH